MAERTWFVTWEAREIRGAHVDAETWEEALMLVLDGDEEGKWVDAAGECQYAVADDHGEIVCPPHDPEPL